MGAAEQLHTYTLEEIDQKFNLTDREISLEYLGIGTQKYNSSRITTTQADIDIYLYDCEEELKLIKLNTLRKKFKEDNIQNLFKIEHGTNN